MAVNRRTFLQQSATLLGAASAVTLLPPSIQRALAIPAAAKTGTLADVEHVVILMQENRSFDHYLGQHAGLRGFNDRTTLPVDTQGSIWNQPDGKGGYVTAFHLDSQSTKAQTISSLPHGWSDGHSAWHAGRWDNWVPAKGALTMGHFSRADLPFHYALADAFTVCDAYFCSCLGPTNTNRLHLMTGMLDVAGTGGGPLIENRPSNVFTWTTYPERLQKAGISWQVYQGSDGSEPFLTTLTPKIPGERDVDYPSPFNVLNFFAAYTAADADPALVAKGTAKRTLADLARDVKAGTLPQVSWLLPPYLCSEHPARSPAEGATYIAAVLDALTANPETWSKTALFITYDENDGFFDHLVPPSPPASPHEGRSNVSTANEFYAGSALNPAGHVGLGARVPMFVISPWSKGAWTCSQVFDHTSIIRFLEQRFGVMEPNISAWRRAVCGDLTSAFDFAQADTRAVSVPSVAGLSAAAAAQSFLPAPSVPLRQVLARQEPGSRNARPLPYQLSVEASEDRGAGSLTLTFANSGTVGAGFIVYSAVTPTSVKHYTVDRQTRLADSWRFVETAAQAPAYDLTVLAPNGFLRRFAASHSSTTALEATVGYAMPAGDLQLDLTNNGSADMTLSITDNRYGAAPQALNLPAGSRRQLPWSLAASKRWYDISITCDADGHFLRQFAGHVETGQPGITDPSMA